MTGPAPATATAHAKVYAGLKTALMNGDFRPGQRIVVREIAEAYRTSAMPAREALRRLVSDGALFDHPNRGVIVPDATVEVISDLGRVRCAIEGSATEWATATITADEIDRLRTLNDAMAACSVAGEAADYLALNRDFHFTIYGAARSPIVLPVIERLWLRAGPWLNIMREEATLGLGLDHHLEMLQALKAGNGAAARRAMVADISGAADIILRAASSGSPLLPARMARRRPPDPETAVASQPVRRP